MKEEIRQRLQNRDMDARVVYGVFRLCLWPDKILDYPGGATSAFPKPLSARIQLLKFSQNLAAYVFQIITFLTFNSEQRPFPFTAWPDDASDHGEQGQ